MGGGGTGQEKKEKEKEKKEAEGKKRKRGGGGGVVAAAAESPRSRRAPAQSGAPPWPPAPRGHLCPPAAPPSPPSQAPPERRPGRRRRRGWRGHRHNVLRGSAAALPFRSRRLADRRGTPRGSGFQSAGPNPSHFWAWDCGGPLLKNSAFRHQKQSETSTFGTVGGTHLTLF